MTRFGRTVEPAPLLLTPLEIESSLRIYKTGVQRLDHFYLTVASLAVHLTADQHATYG